MYDPLRSRSIRVIQISVGFGHVATCFVLLHSASFTPLQTVHRGRVPQGQYGGDSVGVERDVVFKMIVTVAEAVGYGCV